MPEAPDALDHAWRPSLSWWMVLDLVVIALVVAVVARRERRRRRERRTPRP